MKIYHIMIHLNFSLLIDSQIDSKIVDNILENDIVLLSGGESDTNLLGPDMGLNLHEGMNTTKPYSILNELMAIPPNHNIKHNTPQIPPRPPHPSPSLTHYPT